MTPPVPQCAPPTNGTHPAVPTATPVQQQAERLLQQERAAPAAAEQAIAIVPTMPEQALAERIKRVLEFDPHRCFPPADNRDVTLEDVQSELLPSVERETQIQPGFAVVHPEIPDAWLVPDGWRRVLCARILGRKFKAILLEKMPSKAELILMRHALNNTGKKMDKAEIGSDMLAYQEATGCSQEAAAEAFHVSQSYSSRLIAPFKRGIPEVLQALRERTICGAVACKLASFSPEVQAKALPMVRGKKRAVALKLLGPFGGKPEKRGKAMKITWNGLTLTINGDPDEKLAALEAKIAEVRKVKDKQGLPDSVIPQLFA